MIIGKTLKSIIQYITEGFARIFGPTNDNYPETGIQPFEGEEYKPNSLLD